MCGLSTTVAHAYTFVLAPCVKEHFEEKHFRPQVNARAWIFFLPLTKEVYQYSSRFLSGQDEQPPFIRAKKNYEVKHDLSIQFRGFMLLIQIWKKAGKIFSLWVVFGQ